MIAAEDRMQQCGYRKHRTVTSRAVDVILYVGDQQITILFSNTLEQEQT
jgi:hypothetical protein